MLDDAQITRRRIEAQQANDLVAARGTIEGHHWDKATEDRVRNCPRESEHDYGPPGYLVWHAWAERMKKHYDQVPCDCGLYLILVEKEKRDA